MNETDRGHLSIVGLLALAACADARGGRPSSPPPQTVTVATARDGGATPPDLTAPRVARSLGERAALAYQALNDARWADARALLDGYDDDISCSDGSLQVRPLEGGGEMVIASRGLARSDATGKVVSHEVFTEACVRYADPELTVLMRKDSVFVRTKDASHVLPHVSDEQTNDFDASVSISDAWVLVLDRGEDWLAVRRRDGKAIRGHHRVASYGSEAPGAAAGPFFLIRREKELLLTSEDAKTVTVKGCPGLLRGAAATPDGLVIHVAKELDGLPATDTHLCFVGRDGITRRRLALGHATCGMRGPVPCAWDLQIATSRLLAFGSYRGDFKLVDAATGMGLPLALPPGAYPDGGSPGGFFRCEDGICLSYAMPSGDTASSAVRFAGGVASLGPTPTRRESRWCSHVGLPVPREVCDPTGDP